MDVFTVTSRDVMAARIGRLSLIELMALEQAIEADIRTVVEVCRRYGWADSSDRTNRLVWLRKVRRELQARRDNLALCSPS